MVGVVRIARASVAAALSATVVASTAAGSCSNGAGDGTCPLPRGSSELASEHLLIQRVFSRAASQGPSLVNDDNGFVDEEIEEVEDTGCDESDVRRRRRQASMCACRRRDSGRRFDGGWVCQDDRMVQEPTRWTNPIWSDEFDGAERSINESKWTIIESGSGNGNNEKQWYTGRDSNLHVADGVLKIVGKREWYGGKPFTSAKIQTEGQGDWGPGTRIEVRAKLPLGVGTWPAIWMMPTERDYGDWPDCGEIDIMEAVGKKHGKVFGTIHTGAYNHMKGTHKGKSFYTNFNEWHTYALEWEGDKLKWYADGNLYNEFQPDNVNDYMKWPFGRRFYLILNLAIGGNLGGPVYFNDDQVMEVDYVRVFCLDGSTSCRTPKFDCCSSCAGKPFCSPRSGNCYDSKRSNYYNTCPMTVPDSQPESEPDRVPDEVMPIEDNTGASETHACCSKCPGKAFCSPVSGSCYDSKAKSYYKSCATEEIITDKPDMPACCEKCQGKGFCSPASGNCYDNKRRDYYESCV